MPGSNWLMPAVVIALVLALLFAATLVKKYQQYKAQQRATVRRIASAIPLIENSLDALKELPLSRGLRVMLRSDVVERLKTISQLHPRYPEIRKLISEARTRLDTEGPDSQASVPAIENSEIFSRFVGAIDRLVEFMEGGGPITGQRTQERLAMLRKLKERRAEVFARYHFVQSSRYRDEGDTHHARMHLQTLIEALRTRGPNTEFVRELHREAEKAQLELVKGGFAAAKELAEEQRDGKDSENRLMESS